MNSKPCRIPKEIYAEVDRIAKDLNLSFPSAMKVWQEKKFNLPKWKNL